MINIKDFELDLLKIDKKSYKIIGIYNIGHLTIKKIDDCGSIYSVNPLYLQINYASGYIEKQNGIKYLIFDHSKKTSASKECNICGILKTLVLIMNHIFVMVVMIKSKKL